MPATRHVALLIEATNAYARGLLHGVAQYNHEHAGWTIYFEPHGLHEPPPKWLKKWKGDGILARLATRRIANAILSVGVPVVELRRVLTIPGISSIGPDHRVVARMVAEHLRERGFRNFAFCGIARGVDPPLDDRADAFVRHIEEAGFQCSVFPAVRAVSWQQEQNSIARWIKSLPKPVGVMTSNDDRGLQVLRVCAAVGAAVPDQVAVVGAGNDDCLCDLSHPPLSSVDLAPGLIGYEAAALLEKIMSGQSVPQQHLLVLPRGIVTRLSTDVLATPDDAVARAVGFIRNRACDGISVGDVLRHVNLCRSAVEPRLKKVLGRTVHQEIRRVQIERAKALLSTTNLPAKQIADQTGFNCVQYLTRVFHKVTGLTPANYRKRMRW
jgi:LacI family transcriptional regulator